MWQMRLNPLMPLIFVVQSIAVPDICKDADAWCINCEGISV